jgi:FTR1 family protein
MDILSKMLEAMVVTLREGIEAALVVGVLLAYLRKTGREALSRYVLLGLAAAILASVAAAVLVQRYGLDPENEVLEGSVMFVAAALVGSLAVWMWRTGRSVRRRLEERLDALAVQGGPSPLTTRAALGIFAFAFLMVLREGVETVLFLAALSGTVGANPLYNALGGGLGLLLAILFGYLLVQGSVRINLRRFFGVTGVVLLILVGKLIAGGFHEFFEVGLIPSSPFWLEVVGLFTRKTTSLLVLILLIALPGLCLAWDAWRMAPPEPAPQATAAERRKHVAGFRRARRWTSATATAALTISLVLGSFLVVQATRGYDPTPVKVAPVDGAIRLAFPENDKIHKHVVDVEGVPVRFFLLKRKDGSLASAFDVCNICPAKGYLQDGEQLICKNCDAPINEATVGMTGGCNPIPLAAEIKDTQVTVSLAELVKGRDRFVKR